MSLFDRLLSLEQRRRRLAARAPAGPLRAYLERPFPDPGKACAETPFLALDLETTGLDPAKHVILSLGAVQMQGSEIRLASARHLVVKTEAALEEANVVIHGLTDDAIAAGLPLEEALTEVLRALSGRVLLAHHAEVEVRFLQAACRQVFGGGFAAPVVDTQWIARRTLERRNRPYGGSDLRLFNLRKGYNLPVYGAHNALSDALAAAELFAAQLAERDNSERPLRLKEFLRSF